MAPAPTMATEGLMTLQLCDRRHPVPIQLSSADHDGRQQEKQSERAEQQRVILREHEKIQQRIANTGQHPGNEACPARIKDAAEINRQQQGHCGGGQCIRRGEIQVFAHRHNTR